MRNSGRQAAGGTDSSSSSDSEAVNPRRGRGAQNSAQAPVGRYTPAKTFLIFSITILDHLLFYVGILQISCSFGNNSI